ncbi:MAG: heavy metal-binding domain-containing protein [Paludibacter sp.]|nr:heavy metal-binding domain-containing protein [Paludibacter sp.]
MKNKIIISALVILTVFITTSGINSSNQDQPKKVEYTCPMHPEVISGKPGECPKCGMDLVKKEAQATKVVYTCSMHPEIISDNPGKCPECGMDLVKKEVAKVEYTCPMHPEVISDKPGKCPKCGMDLVKKENGTKKKCKMMQGCGMMNM